MTVMRTQLCPEQGMSLRPMRHTWLQAPMLGLFEGLMRCPQSSLRPRLSLHGEPDEAHTNRIDPDD